MEPPSRETLEESQSTPRRVKADATEPAGYGSIAAGAAYMEVPQKTGDVESAPLLTPEPGETGGSWRPLTKEELEDLAGGPRWRKIRSRLVFLFWMSWLAMLGTAVAIVVKSPRPEPAPLRWWQRSLFYQLQPALFMDYDPGSGGGVEALCDRLPYIKSLGVGAMIMEGLFLKGPSSEGPVINDSLVTEPQVEHIIKESSKVGLRVLLDLCELNLTTSRMEVSEANDTGLSAANETSVSPQRLTGVQHALKSWLEKGVAGFAVCDTDPAYSEQSLAEWRLVVQGFNQADDDRIVLVKQTGGGLNSTPSLNGSLVDVVMRSILPPTHHILSAQEVAESMEACLLAPRGAAWPSWTVGGQLSPVFQKMLLVLVMTVPGTPALQYGEERCSVQTEPLNTTLPLHEDAPSSDTEKERRLALALFTSLRLSKAREEALRSGSFTMLPFTNGSSSTANSTLRPPVLGFLRAWGCVQLLVVLNIGPEPQLLDPGWARGLPGTGVFMVSTGLARMGSVSLDTLSLQPHEAVVIKLIEARSFS